MDTTKLQGILSAIEEEAKMPSPSHQNLARLVSMFFQETIKSYEPQVYTSTETRGSEPEPIEEVEEPVKKKKRRG